MRYGIINNVAGNVDAMANIDRQFDELGVDYRVCLGNVVGIYPFVNECIESLIVRKYVVLRGYVDEGFITYCQGKEDFEGWSTRHVVNALIFVAPSVSRFSLDFLERLPVSESIGEFGFKSRVEVRSGYLYDKKDAAVAFSKWSQRIIFHSLHTESHLWREDLTGDFLSTGENQLPPTGRFLVSAGGMGSRYHGSKKPAAILFDDASLSVEILQPMCDFESIIERLRATKYPLGPLGFLESYEYETWRIK
jgi:hypothetical protein